MSTNECKRKDCKNFGIELCVRSRVHHDECGVCTDYERNQPTEIKVRPEDLNASFNPRCQKKDRGVYKSVNITKVLK
jgi:hypothetical protein